MPQTSPTASTLVDRAVIRLSGEGVRDFLQGLVTQDVAGDLPVWAGLLTPQGKCLFDFIVWVDGDCYGDTCWTGNFYADFEGLPRDDRRFEQGFIELMGHVDATYRTKQPSLVKLSELE